MTLSALGKRVMKLPSKEALEYTLMILEAQINDLECCIDMYPKDSDAAEDGGWNISKNNIKEVIEWIRGYVRGPLNEDLHCERCGSSSGHYQLDPFLFEVEDDWTEYIICDKCADERHDDI